MASQVGTGQHRTRAWVCGRSSGALGSLRAVGGPPGPVSSGIAVSLLRVGPQRARAPTDSSKCPSLFPPGSEVPGCAAFPAPLERPPKAQRPREGGEGSGALLAGKDRQPPASVSPSEPLNDARLLLYTLSLRSPETLTLLGVGQTANGPPRGKAAAWQHLSGSHLFL
ncbi:hypothetical protein MG293_019250 [Ovis ammon polii]|uniref:Uncharacterized protein n=1 Tax=Ovis ammon polii TaxID=230172 RepID=A0AAD4TNL9_OVIAM|nr:hypothetical protein MG293_019250 [Ovis ammon polii]